MNKEIILSKIAALETALAELRREVEGDAPQASDEYAGFKYPPCDLSNADVGDTIELWGGQVGKVTKLTATGMYEITTQFGDSEELFLLNGMYDGLLFPDSQNNVRRLIKKTPTA